MTNWLAELDSKRVGYSEVSIKNDESRNSTPEEVIDADTDVFRMLPAFNASLAGWAPRASYEVPNYNEIQTNAREILEAYERRQRILAKLCA